MLQYALLHLYGYELSIDDLKKFRVCTTKIMLSKHLVLIPCS